QARAVSEPQRLAVADARPARVPAQCREGRGLSVREVIVVPAKRSASRNPYAVAEVIEQAPAQGRGDVWLVSQAAWQPAYPHHILHKYRACTASAWPFRPDVVSRQHSFRPPPMTDRNARNRLRRWRYFAHELYLLQRPNDLSARLVLHRHARPGRSGYRGRDPR